MIIIDNFIQDAVLLEEIQHDKEFFGPNGSIQANLIQQSHINNWISNARATFRNCKCL